VNFSCSNSLVVHGFGVALPREQVGLGVADGLAETDGELVTGEGVGLVGVHAVSTANAAAATTGLIGLLPGLGISREYSSVACRVGGYPQAVPILVPPWAWVAVE
jgi:hypothetical protein